MKLLVVLVLVSAVSAAPQTGSRVVSTPEVQLLRFDADNDGLGTYSYAFEQTDGQKRNEAGELRKAGTDDESISVKGSYSWVGPDGVEYIVNYTADEDGYKPTIEQGPLGQIPAGVVASLLG